MASVHEETFNGRQAWVLANGWMRVSVLAGRGHIAEVRLLADDSKKNLNPMRVPHYPTIEPYQYDPARDDALYGTTLRIADFRSVTWGTCLAFRFTGRSQPTKRAPDWEITAKPPSCNGVK
jgi:hypothetical protein